jgi:hypothetical protein
MWISLELHVSRKTVRLARHRLGVAALPVGRPRGHARTIRMSNEKPAAMLIAARIGRGSQAGRATPTVDLIGACVADLQRCESDQDAFDDALLALAATCGLVYDHRRRLRAV